MQEVDIQPGSLFEGQYEIIRQVGAGGMGAVYLASKPGDPGFKVAIKILYPGKIANHEARERFRNEIIATRKIEHENVVRAYDYFDREDFQAYAMEWVDGGDLQQRMKEGRMDQKRVVHYLRQIAAGLEAVHEEAIIHRDLKPDNLLITDDDILKLSDFGVARLKGASSLTLVGAMVGTPKYLSPEYVETGTCDHRGDIYATGVIGYEMVRGESPFRSATKVSLMVERLKVRVEPLSECEPDCHPKLAAIIDRAMSVRVSERYQSAREMREELEALEAELWPELSRTRGGRGPGSKDPAVLTTIIRSTARPGVLRALFLQLCFWSLIVCAIVSGLYIGVQVCNRVAGVNLDLQTVLNARPE